MHLAFVTPDTVHHGETDAACRFDRVAQILEGRGHDVTVLCRPWWEADDVDEFEQEDVDYLGVSDSRRLYLWKLPLVLRRLDPDIVHVDATSPASVVAASYGVGFVDAPMVVEWYDTPMDAKRARRAARTGDTLVVPSRLIRTRIQEAGVRPDRTRVVPTPVDGNQIRSIDPDPDLENEFVYARRLDEGANLESVLLALAEVERPEWSVTVIGDGPRREEYEDQAEELEIAEQVTFAGELPREERIAAYRAGQAFVQTATHCVFPEELAWALLAGCVGIVEYHADSSAHELVEGRERGFRATTEGELVAALGEAHDRDHQAFDESFADLGGRHVVERYIDCYRTLLDERGLL